MIKFDSHLEKAQDDDVLCHNQNLFKVGKFKNEIITAFKQVIPNVLQEQLARQSLDIQHKKWVGTGHKKQLITDNSTLLPMSDRL